MSKVSLALLGILMSTISISQTQTGKFEIIGNLTGFKDSIYIGLYDFSTGENVFMDSARVINGKFVFKGAINKDYQSVGLICQENIKVFWIEGGVIHFNGEKGNFDRAAITGSALQEENNQFDSIVRINPKNEKKHLSPT